jgi:Cu/Ag efflux protein CusF
MVPDKEFQMMCLKKWLGATLAIALLASTAAAADTVASGKVKSINADNKTFVLTDSADKDFTFKLGEKLVINRAGKETKSDLKAGDVINVCYDKGIVNRTAHYILVQEGTSKNSELIRGNVKSYDADKKELTFTNEVKKDSTYAIGKAMVRVNMEDAKIDSVKIGDHALLIVNTVEGKSTLRSVMVDRAK